MLQQLKGKYAELQGQVQKLEDQLKVCVISLKSSSNLSLCLVSYTTIVVTTPCC